MRLAEFHPAVRGWFEETLGQPTLPQALGWPSIRAGAHTLIAAPTGHGKTLAAFLASIDDLVRQYCTEGTLPDATSVLYISPLKALSNDIGRNLLVPLQGIETKLREMGYPSLPIRAAVRTGDTPPSMRQAMLKTPPHILVTTPESLYILLTSQKGPALLRTVRTVIVDEIHALLQDKRGSHLAVSLERLHGLCPVAPVRIGLSATQKPLEEVGKFLTGPGRPFEIIDAGYSRNRDLALELPKSPLESVMSAEVWSEVYERLTELINEHRTTLVFVNTRRLAERLSRALSERLGEAYVTSHHGSLSKELRLRAEQRLKDGQLKALVATASLELGIDIGEVDLMCQIGSPRSIAAFLQRVGRSGHSLTGIPKGRLFPLSRDELLECTALLDAVRREELDAVQIPRSPLDILAQQLVAMVANQEWQEDELFETITRSYPYHDLGRKTFDDVVRMLGSGFSTQRGRRGAHLHHDAVNRVLRPRRGSRLVAMTSGGAIPDNADYDVVLEPSDMIVGTVNEDFAIESLPGNIFQLGNTSWQITRVESNKLRVKDAQGKPPNMPFWFGEARGRSRELSYAVSRLRAEIQSRLGRDATDTAAAVAWLEQEVGIDRAAARQLSDYLACARAVLGLLPTQKSVVAERFFDEGGNQHVVLHAPFGDRINRAWGLALRKRFCKSFNFELQAAATDDAIILSLGPTHSFPLDDVFGFLHPNTAKEVLTQALLDAPMFGTRWRWNSCRALAVPRFRGGKKTPPALQRMMAEDLIAVCFPDQLACLENIQGNREIPDHPLVQQTIHDCLTEAMDVDGLLDILTRMASGDIQCMAKDLTEPSPLALEILGARPYAFLDDAPLEERRTRAVNARRWLSAKDASAIGALDTSAISRVKEQAWPKPRNSEELHDALVLSGYWTPQEGQDYLKFFEDLARQGRVAVLHHAQNRLWIAIERATEWRALAPSSTMHPPLIALENPQEFSADEAARELLRSRLEISGPTTVHDLSASSGLAETLVRAALVALESEGFVMRGQFTGSSHGEEWCERRLLARIHHGTLERLRQEIEPVSRVAFLDFLTHWQHAAPNTRMEGMEGLAALIEQLEGYVAPAAAWEQYIFPARMAKYDPDWLDTLCLLGRISWARIATARPQTDIARSSHAGGPIKSTPLIIARRSALGHWFTRDASHGALSSTAQKVLEQLRNHGASYFADLALGTGLLGVQLQNALAELVSAALISADSFAGLRALLSPQRPRSTEPARRSRFQRASFEQRMERAGRWFVLSPTGSDGPEASIETKARTLLRRYGVVFRAIIERENKLPPWRELLHVYRGLEARGEIRQGRFVSGFAGEQYALPEAVAMIRQQKKQAPSGLHLSLSAADPLNLLGILDHQPRLSTMLPNRFLLRDGVTIAALQAGEVAWLADVPERMRWSLKNALIRVSRPGDHSVRGQQSPVQGPA
ncbi:MAG: DEAD/DEAH box helicase [Myxococcales bacterium]|nr:DEAD/DEAH box helicase [Myxococcales bacterium]